MFPRNRRYAATRVEDRSRSGSFQAADQLSLDRNLLLQVFQFVGLNAELCISIEAYMACRRCSIPT